jgi:hypothetical protein
VINGVCQEVFDRFCAPGVNPLLCGNGEHDFLTKAAKTTGTAIVDFFKPDESDFLQNRQQPTDCGFQFGSWCALDTCLDPLLRLAADNPECAFMISLTGSVAVSAYWNPGAAAAFANMLLEATTTTCMTR